MGKTVITRHTTVGFKSRYPVLAYLYFGIQLAGDTPNPVKFLKKFSTLFDSQNSKTFPEYL